MNFERFISTFVMMNIVLFMFAAFSAKNDLMMKTAAEIIYGKKTDTSYFELKPSEITDFERDKPALIAKTLKDIYAKTYIKEADIAAVRSLPPYEKAVALVKIFSLMGDGECLTGSDIVTKINAAAEKKGCAKDFAQIFSFLASSSELESRIVSNGTHYGAEIFDGQKWIYLDPYFAMSVSSETGHMSYIEFSEAMLSDGWMRFNYFGGENHCMSGKPIAEHPYFGDKGAFANVYTLNGNNVIKMLNLEQEYKSRHAIVTFLGPERAGTTKTVYTELSAGSGNLLRKYVTLFLTVITLIFTGTNIVLPAYYILGLIFRKRK